MKATLLLPLLAHASMALASQIPLRASLYSQPAEISMGAASALDDPVQSASSGAGGPLRIELPFQPEQYAHLAGAAVKAASKDKAQDAVLTVKDIVRAQGGEFVHLTHADVPDVTMRLRRLAQGRKPDEVEAAKLDPSAFCDPTVDSWSGYIDFIEGHSLFFYFFESRSDPDKDPLISFMNGGPGCASELALLFELGPCTIKEGPTTGLPINGTLTNPFSWNDRANLLFLDQPVDVGFSYRRYGSHVFDSNAAASDFVKFLQLFYSAFEDLRNRPYILSSESYGGRYVPRFAAEIVDQNRKLRMQKGKAASKHLIPLAKVAIGNGLTDIVEQIPGYYDYLCTAANGVTSEPILSIAACHRMASWRAKCSKWLRKACREENNFDDCGVAAETCEDALFGPYSALKRNPYDVLDDCRSGLTPNLCYDAVGDIRDYANRDDVRALLGAASKRDIGLYTGCNENVAAGFARAHDSTVDNTVYVEQLLEHGIEVLVFAGTKDVICNHVGNRLWIDKLEWSAGDAFKHDPLRPWLVEGERAGETQSGGLLTWATVDMAGHMVPHDKPKEALALIQRFIDGQKL